MSISRKLTKKKKPVSVKAKSTHGYFLRSLSVLPDFVEEKPLRKKSTSKKLKAKILEEKHAKLFQSCDVMVVPEIVNSSFANNISEKKIENISVVNILDQKPASSSDQIAMLSIADSKMESKKELIIPEQGSDMQGLSLSSEHKSPSHESLENEFQFIAVPESLNLQAVMPDNKLEDKNLIFQIVEPSHFAIESKTSLPEIATPFNLQEDKKETSKEIFVPEEKTLISLFATPDILPVDQSAALPVFLEQKEIINHERIDLPIIPENKAIGIPEFIPNVVIEEAKSYPVPAEEVLISQSRVVNAPNWEMDIPKIAINAGEEKKMIKEGNQSPESLLNMIRCPISLEIMKDPVMTIEGQTYERDAIESWFQSGKNTDPLTNKPLKSLNLITNYAMKSIVENILTLSGDPKKSHDEFESEQKSISDLLKPLEKYAFATGFQAFTKGHQPEAKNVLIKLRAGICILNRCDQQEYEEKLQVVFEILAKSKPKKDFGEYLKSLLQVEQNIKNHYSNRRHSANKP